MKHPFPRRLSAALVLLAWSTAPFAQAAGGPPLLTDDPGTPGDKRWEVNVAFTAEHRPGVGEYEAPLLDINYGVGDRIQLKYEVAYLTSDEAAEPTEHGISNSLLGVKWRFYDSGGLSVSTYPQLELNNPTDSLRRGLVEQGPAMLLPVEVNYDAGPWSLGLEAGRWLSAHRPEENILGVMAGRAIGEQLELLGEIYTTWSQDEGRTSSLNLGGRYEFLEGKRLMVMAGHSLPGSAETRQWVGYVGLQFEFGPE